MNLDYMTEQAFPNSGSLELYGKYALRVHEFVRYKEDAKDMMVIGEEVRCY